MSANAPPPTALIVAIATTPNAETPAWVATIAPVVANAASPMASETTVSPCSSGARKLTLSATANPEPRSPRLISVGDCNTSGRRFTRRSRVTPPTNAVVSPTTTIPKRSNSSRIALAEPTRANATNPIVFIIRNGSPNSAETSCRIMTVDELLADVDEVLEDFLTLFGVDDFGVPLDAVEIAVGVAHGLDATDVRGAGVGEAIGDGLDLVGMTGPDACLGRDRTDEWVLVVEDLDG